MSTESGKVHYDSILCKGPIAWIDRVQIRIPCGLLIFPHASPWNPLPDKHGFQHALPSALQPSGAFVKRGWQGQTEFVYIDLLSIPLDHRRVVSSIVDILSDLFERNILGMKGKAGSDLRRKALDCLHLAELNEVEWRCDVAAPPPKSSERRAPSLSTSILNSLEELRDEEGHITLSRWEKRHEQGYYVKAYERRGFVRIEVVLYRRNFVGQPLSAILTFANQMVHNLFPVVHAIVSRLAKRTPAIQSILAVLVNWKTLKERAREFTVQKYPCWGSAFWDISRRAIRVAQEDDVF